jgi:hypothetical protein
VIAAAQTMFDLHIHHEKRLPVFAIFSEWLTPMSPD